MDNMMAKEVPQFLMGANGLIGYESNGRQIRLISEINQIAAIGTPFAILPGDGAAVVCAVSSVVLDRSLAAGAVAVAGVVVVQRVWGRRPVPRPVVVGMRQLGLGLAVVAATAIGVLAAAS